MDKGFRLRIAGLASVIALLAVFPAMATEPTASPTARQLELANRYLAASQAEKMMNETMKPLLQMLTVQLSQRFPSLSTEQLTAIHEAGAEASSAMFAEISLRFTPLLAETFSDGELQNLVDFYEGPTGRSVLEKMPTLMAKMTPLMIELTPKMQADMMQRVCAKLDCEGTPLGKTKPKT